ncbi:MAG: hypothetical protein ACREYE_10950 [Gammaproteobacteria bacterium]
MSETIAITGKSVKLFKGHYTRYRSAVINSCWSPSSSTALRYSAAKCGSFRKLSMVASSWSR